MQLQFQNVDILNCKSDYVNMYRHLWISFDPQLLFLVVLRHNY